MKFRSGELLETCIEGTLFRVSGLPLFFLAIKSKLCYTILYNMKFIDIFQENCPTRVKMVMGKFLILFNSI